jgi:hypothetical protein
MGRYTKMQEKTQAALRLHRHLLATHWNGGGVVGPDMGVRFGYRLGRFIKSYLHFFPWRESYYYVQAQAYWILANWRLYEQTNDEGCRDIAIRCSEHLMENQRADGTWDYPDPEWKGRIATVECTWGSIGLLESYRQTGDQRFLSGALLWHKTLIDKVGFTQDGDGLAANYFAKRGSSPVPNVSAIVLRFLSELTSVTGDEIYAEPCSGMATFMRNAQKPNGEFPYVVRARRPIGRRQEHFQCYQYNAFQFLDLARYFENSGDSTMPAVLARSFDFLCGGIADDGHAYYDCSKSGRTVVYHAAVLAAAFEVARGLGFSAAEELAQRAFHFVLGEENPNGGFPHSHGDYHLLSDRRSYPRCLSMILLHLLEKETAVELKRPRRPEVVSN